MLLPTILAGRNETFNWYFGENAAITFNTPDGEPLAIQGSNLVTLEGTSSISDTNGHLLFYTDGVKVWNRLHQLMNPQQNLMGHYSSTQSAMIVRCPKSYNKYYIFTTDAGKYIENINPDNYINRGFRYSVVDMNQNNGLGEVIEFNHLLYEPVTEKVTSVNHKNLTDIWIISHEYGTKNVITYLLTENGISQKVISESSASHDGDDDRYIGHIKASPHGDKIAYLVQGFNFIELQDFDNETGKLSSPLRITTDNRKENYGLEFSPSGKLLYVSDYKTNTIYQYDISSHNADSIKATEKLIKAVTNTHSIGALQLAPNGKIYLAQNELRFLGVINHPDFYGDSCDYVRDGVFLGEGNGVRSRLGLPNLNQSLYNLDVRIEYKETCQHQVLGLRAVVEAEFEDMEFEWHGPNGFYSNNKDIIFTNASQQLNGQYSVKVRYREYFSEDRVDVQIKYAPQINIKGDTLICQNSFSKLEASIKSDTLDYFWSTGQRGWETIISSPGEYILQTLYPNGCSSYDTIVVNGLITNAGFRNPNAGLFGDIPIDRNRRISFEFFNSANETLIINSVYLQNNTSQLKIFKSNNSEIIIPPHSNRIFEIDIFSKKPVSINDTLILEVTSPYCIMQFKVAIIGNIIVPVLTTIPVINSSPADEIVIPIISKINTPSDTSFFLPFNIEITIPTEYFYLESCTNGEIIRNESIDGTRHIHIEGASTRISESTSAVLALVGKVMIGTIEPGEIAVKKIDWNNSLFRNTFKSGELRIESCSLAVRPIKLFKPTKFSLYPNPVSNHYLNVRIESEERGEFKLYLMNTLGGKIELAEWNRTSSEPIEKIFNFNIGNFSTGGYMLILQSPWHLNSEMINIIR